ncbi:MAG: glycosyltransferase family 2 protein [Burkholderiales bacterium]|nr:glycosyltransferase family 2 protein [Burkholderiales bacterium]
MGRSSRDVAARPAAPSAQPCWSPWRVWEWLHARRIERRHARRLQRDYAGWVQAHDTLTPAVREALAQRQAALPARPTIGLMIDARGAGRDGRNGDEALRASVASVQAQLYPHWQLCLVGVAEGFDAAAPDPRIRCLQPSAAEPQAAWPQALGAVEAPWWAELDAGDRLAPQALLLYAEAAVRLAGVEAIYCDHDRLDGLGRRRHPQFKGDWNPELLLASAYVQPLLMLGQARLRAALAAVAGRAPAPDKATRQHGLALRATAGLGPAAVRHIPHVLVHAAASPVASAEAAQAHLDESGPSGLTARVRPSRLGGLEVSLRPALRHGAGRPAASLIVPTRDRLPLLRRCVESVLARTAGVDFELLIVDNGSRERRTLHWLQALVQREPRVRVLRDDRPFNFAALNNAAAAQARGEHLLLLNNDTEVITPDWLAQMLGAAALPGVAAVGARLWYRDWRLQHAGLILGLEGVAGDSHARLGPGSGGVQARAHLIQGCSAVTAACLLVRRSVYLALGGMDEQRFAVAYNDVDFCLRLTAAGHRIVWTPRAQLFHDESRSRGSDAAPARRARFERERAAMLERWGPMLQRDPAYNPNLALQGGAFGLAWPPRVSLLRPWFEGPPA